ncbi:MAG: RecX family transcriptional regulator, partial [Clostridiaceae bacterium]|nr:RecX family transcriptional regulator [Clostridiaceae bacterium]
EGKCFAHSEFSVKCLVQNILVVKSMKITGIEEQKKNSKRYNIYIDNEYYCSIDKDILEELHFYEEMEFNENEFSKILERVQYKSALKAALYILTHASKTERELEKKLMDKQHSERAIRQVLEYLREIGYVNDESYTESFIRSMRDVTGISRKSLYYKLAGKGIDKVIIQQKLDEAEIDDYTSALKAAKKKVVNLKGNKREKSSKLFSFLCRKGYGIEICRKLIEELELEDN